jgi:hypothetical protein
MQKLTFCLCQSWATTIVAQGSAEFHTEMRVVQPLRDADVSAPFDVFLSYNSQDRGEVVPICRSLRDEGVKAWFDQDQLRPGFPFQEVVERQLVRCGAAAVFVGKRNLGPWQVQEVRAVLILLLKRKRPVIPVLLPSATRVPELPLFLADMTWVDFRKDPRRALAQLVWGITGRRPPSLDA